MTNTELTIFIERWISNSAIDAFTNLRLQTVLLSLVTGGITDSFADLPTFRQAILDNRTAGHDWYMRARVLDTSFIYEYFPNGDGTGSINWTASQQLETI